MSFRALRGIYRRLFVDPSRGAEDDKGAVADTIRPIERLTTPERVVAPFERAEKAAPLEEAVVDGIPTEKIAEQPQPVQRQTAGGAVKSALMERVEKILEEEIGEVYFSMDESHKEHFKKKGEETARTIEGLIAKARATAQVIVTLIKSWLRLIPGVSSFFIEQEAKIKTDKLLRLQQQRPDRH